MKFGGVSRSGAQTRPSPSFTHSSGPVSRQADPGFNDEFTWCNYIIKYYTLGVCGLCGMKVKRWVDASIVMGEPKFDEDMAKEDAEADAANPTDLNRRYTNQSMSGPPGFLDPNRAVSFNTTHSKHHKQMSGVV